MSKLAAINSPKIPELSNSMISMTYVVNSGVSVQIGAQFGYFGKYGGLAPKHPNCL